MRKFGPDSQMQQRGFENTRVASSRGKLDPLQMSPYSVAHHRRRKGGQRSKSQDAQKKSRDHRVNNKKGNDAIAEGRGRTDSIEEADEEADEEEYSYNEISVEQQIDSAMMKCNSPFLDAIFGAKEDKHRRDTWDRQRLAYDILSEPVNTSDAMKGRGSPALSAGISNNFNTTTTETTSDISSISEMVSGKFDVRHPRLGGKRRGDSGKNSVDASVDKTAQKNPRALSSPPDSVTRIIAPNVEKLPAHSVVEICLQGEEVVSVLCSVDTLKMRSEYFFEHLSALDRKSDEQSSIGTIPLVIDDPCPFEAAAYLESMHDGGKSLSGRGSWSFHFARLR